MDSENRSEAFLADTVSISLIPLQLRDSPTDVYSVLFYFNGAVEADERFAFLEEVLDRIEEHFRPE